MPRNCFHQAVFIISEISLVIFVTKPKRKE